VTSSENTSNNNQQRHQSNSSSFKEESSIQIEELLNIQINDYLDPSSIEVENQAVESVVSINTADQLKSLEEGENSSEAVRIEYNEFRTQSHSREPIIDLDQFEESKEPYVDF